jgi:hypothetical protein
VVEELRNADLVFVYYENNCLNSAWACSSKFYAAVFAGKPVLCNRLPAFSAFAERWGGCIFLDSLSRDEIADRLGMVFGTPGVYEQLVQDMRKARADFAERYAAIPEELRTTVRQCLDGDLKGGRLGAREGGQSICV